MPSTVGGRSGAVTCGLTPRWGLAGALVQRSRAVDPAGCMLSPTLGNHRVMRLLLGLTSVAAVIGLAAPAHADATQDQAFLVALQAAGITYNSPDNAVAAGKDVCEMAKSGKPGVEVVKVLQSQNPGLNQTN